MNSSLVSSMIAPLFSNPMFLLAIVVIVVVSILAPAAGRRRGRGRKSPPFKLVPRDELGHNEDPPKFEVHYVARKPLTATEILFFRRLAEALPEAVIVPQMAMAALVDIAAHQKRGRAADFLHTNRAGFAQKRLDYVVLDRETLAVVCVIELDDHTHDSEERQLKDAERDAILEGVGYSMLRFDARKMPTAQELRDYFEA